ncbi:MAG: thiol reductant ABC exporter subunit CydD [Actinomycetota bacterium]|nr:thiol reductant ABC exporter subunit CydD [Actinomycetota bacterium]
MSRHPHTDQPRTGTDRTKPIDRRLFGVTGGVRRYLGVTIGLGLASAIAVIIGAMLLASIVNRIFLGDAVAGDLVGMLVALGLVYSARGVLEWGRSVSAFRAAAGVKRTLREQVMRAVLMQTAQGRLPAGSGDLALTATTGIDSLDAYFSRYLPQLVLGALIPLAAVAWIVFVDPLTAVIIIITVPLIPVFMMLIGNYADRATRERWRTIRGLGDGLVETLRGLLTLEVYRSGKGRLDRFQRLSDEYRKQTMATLRIAFLSAFVLELVATMSVAVIAVAVGIRVVQGNLDFEPALAILILAPEVYVPLRKAGTEFHAAMDGMEAAHSVFAVLEATPKEAPQIDVGAAPRPVTGAPFIEFAAVSYRYPSSAEPGPAVLDGIDLRIGRGEHVAVIGPSGAGKSTLIRLILGFDRPASGEIVIEGVPLSGIDPAAWRSEIGWVRQDPFLIAGTVLDNIRLGAPEAGVDEVAAALDLTGAGDLIPRLGDVMGERGAGLSHGQRRMVTLARAILRDPALLLLDEPTAGIDSETQLRIAGSFERFAAGRTVLTVAHQRVLVDLADRVIVIDGGRIIAPAAGGRR